MTRHPASERFHQILGSLGDLHDAKQADYGSESDPFANVRASEDFGVPAWLGAVIRLNDKVNRLKAYARRGSLRNEAVIDSFDDIAVYAVIARVLFEQGRRRLRRGPGARPGAAGRGRRGRKRPGEAGPIEEGR